VIGGCLAIDVVHADACAADGFEVFRFGEEFGGDFGLGANDEAVVVTDDFEEFFRLEAGVHVHGDARSIAQGVHALVRDRVRYQHAIVCHRRGGLNHRPAAGKGGFAEKDMVFAGFGKTNESGRSGPYAIAYGSVMAWMAHALLRAVP
jgi:hypothetical protein